MKPMSFAAVLLFSFALIGCGDAAQTDEVVYVDTPAGAKLLQTASVQGQFWPLMRHFQSEQIDTYCGVASSVMVLNALWDKRRIEAPAAPTTYPCSDFDQSNIFTAEMLHKMWQFTPQKQVHSIMGGGVTLDELSNLLKAASSSVTVETYHMDDPKVNTVKGFRDMAIAALKSTDRYVLVNFFRHGVDQAGEGHVSPLAAYDANSDRFLILDVARYKYPPGWATAAQLWTAMNSVDSSAGGKKRGFVIVSAAPKLVVQKFEGARDCPDPDALRAQFFGMQKK
jgi:hypothetical protein